LIDWLVGCLGGWLTGLFVGWVLVHWVVVYWRAASLADLFFVVWLVGGSVGLVVALLGVGWWAGWLVGRPAGSLVV